MGLYQLALRNLKSHPGRTLALVAVLAVAVTTCVSLYEISTSMSNDLQNKIDEYGANIVITPSVDEHAQAYAGVSAGSSKQEDNLLKVSDINKIMSIKNAANINIVAPKVLSTIALKNQNVIVAGVRFKDELKLKQWWEVRAGSSPKSTREALLGGKVARDLNLKPGDELYIKDTLFKITGILKRTGMQEDDFVYIDLYRAQNILGVPGRLSLIEISAWCKDCPIDDIVAQMHKQLPEAKVSAVKQAAETRQAVIGQFKLLSLALSVTMLAIAILIVLSNVVSTIREQRRDIGILRAIGYRRLHILALFMLQITFTSVIAGIVGFCIGFLGSSALSSALLNLDVGFNFNPVLALAAVGLSTFIAVATGFFPAFRAASTSPADIMQQF